MARGRHARTVPRRTALGALGLVLLLVGGGSGIWVVARDAGWGRPAHRHTPTATHPGNGPRTTARPTRAHATTRPPTATTYKVKPGDTLWDIAAAFRLQGRVVTLYEWNRSVIGRNPDLIFPGQVIIVDPTGKIRVGT